MLAPRDVQVKVGQVIEATSPSITERHRVIFAAIKLLGIGHDT
jgi:hypothetical protein